MAKSRLNEKWESILEDCLTRYGFSTFRIDMKEPSAAEARRSANSAIKSVSLQGRLRTDFKVEFLVMKTIGEQENDEERLLRKDMFATEHRFYGRVVPAFEAMQADLPAADKFTFPLCYESSPEFVVMADLTMQNFAEEPATTLDFEKTALAITELARFHAFSLAMAHNKPTEYAELVRDLNKGFFHYAPLEPKTFEEALGTATECLEYDEMRNRFRSACLANYDKVKAQISETIVERGGGVIAHGDYSKNNLMFRCDEDGEPVDVAMLDYQLAHVARPIVDVLSLLLSSSREFLGYERFLDMYHDSLRLFLKKFCCRVDELYPRSAMTHEFREYLFYGVVQFLCDASKNHDEDSFRTRIKQLVRELDLLKFI